MSKILKLQSFLVARRTLSHWRYIVIAMVALFSVKGAYAVESNETLRQIIEKELVSVKGDNKPITYFLDELKRQANIEFGFREPLSPNDMGNFSIDVVNVSVKDVLNELFINSRYAYNIEGNKVVIYQKNYKSQKSSDKQNVSGIVVDEFGSPVVGATVLILGTTDGAITDNSGRFSLLVERGNTIEISFTGLETANIVIEEGVSELSIKMITDKLAMKDVVVTGFYTRGKDSFTGAVKTITAEELKSVSNTSVINAISALTPGLNIQVDNAAGSNPNNIPELVLRGTSSIASSNGTPPNQPIIMLDGVQISMEELYDLDINDIERVNVLKDASATALYGEQASNGVIVIERKAIALDDIQVNYTLSGTVTAPDISSYDYLNAAEKLDFERLAGVYDMGNYQDYESYMEKMRRVAEGTNTNWLSKPLRVGSTINNSLSLTGRTGRLQYRVSANYNTTNGVMKGDNRTSMGVNSFLMYRIDQKIQISLQTSYTSTESVASPYGSFSDYVKLNPYDSPYDEYGNIAPLLSWDVENPLYDATKGSFDKNVNNILTNTVDVRWNILSNLFLTAQGSLRTGDGSDLIFVSPFSADELSDPIDERGSMKDVNSKMTSYSGKITLNYNKKFGDNTLSVVAGGDIYKDTNLSTTYFSIGYINDDLAVPGFATGYNDGSKPTSTDNTVARMGAFANVNFSIKDKYFVDGSIRNSGSSQFGANNRYAPFWSVGAGWNLHKEKMFSESVFSKLRLRYSYGVTGSVDFSPYQAMTTYSYSNRYYYYEGIGAVPLTMGNPDLEWQTLLQNSVGADATLFNNRLDLTVNAYHNKTKGMLSTLSIPSSVGVTTVYQNLGDMLNTGIEFDIMGVLYSNKDWRVQMTVNGSHNRNKILSISDNLKKTNDTNSSSSSELPKILYEEGQSTTAIYAVQSLGINPADGKELFMTKDGAVTDVYDTDDKVVMGDTTPKIEGYIMPSVQWKNLSLNVTMGYRLGGDVYNSTRAYNVEDVNPLNNVDRRAYDLRWVNPNDIVPYLDITNTESRTNYHTSRFIERDNTLDISRVEVAYDFASNILKRVGFKRLRISAGMDNVARISTVRYERGTSYPFSRGFSFTIRPTF